jgi:hypothetical protein
VIRALIIAVQDELDISMPLVLEARLKILTHTALFSITEEAGFRVRGISTRKRRRR